MKSNKKEIKESRPKPKKEPVGKTEDIKRLIQLLQIHQIELEHQNEELRITQGELEVSRNKYVSLFDFAPIPYFTLNPDGVITEANLMAGKMLGYDRNKLMGKRLITFTLPAERDVFKLFLHTVFSSHIKSSCELKVIDKDKQIFSVRLEGLEFEDTLQTDQKCQVALIEL
jgi:PAS domain S-box-containing protein